MKTMQEEVIDLLKQLIAIPSISGEEQGTAQAISQFLQSKGVVARRHKNNVWAVNKYYDKAKPTILLNSHHDTVKPNHAYTKDPFHPIVEDGKLYGLGSNDAGGALVSLLATFLHFYERADMKYNLLYAASAEEEISGYNGVESLLQEIGPIHAAIVGEPTQMQMATSEKGLLVIDCTVNGTSAHAAHNMGVNAIYEAMKDIEWFSQYKYPVESDLLGPVKMSVTIINAGTQHNMIPARCNFTVDIRTNEHYTHQQVLDIICQHVSCEVKPRSVRLRSTSIAEDHPLVQAGTHLGLNCFGSPTLSDKALMPFPALKMGPGDTQRSHIADEFIYVDEIHSGIDIYTQLLNQLL